MQLEQQQSFRSGFIAEYVSQSYCSGLMPRTVLFKLLNVYYAASSFLFHFINIDN